MKSTQVDEQKLEAFLSLINENEDIYELIETFGETPHECMQCLVHDDTHPSMYVDRGKGVWHCFSCGAGGHYTDLQYQYARVHFGEKRPKPIYWAQYLEQNVEMQKKYGMPNLYTELKYSRESLEYLFKSSEAIRKQRIVNLKQDVKNEGYLLIRNFKSLPIGGEKEDREILEYLANIQRNEIT